MSLDSTQHQAQVSILVLFYSRHGTIQNIANQIARGIRSIKGCDAKLRTVPEIAIAGEDARHVQSDTLEVSLEELKTCDGLALGAPVWFGAMPAAMKHFWDQSSALWLRGDLIDKPACVFTASSSPRGGQEVNLQGLMQPLFHHGMLVMGIPYSEPELHSTLQGGTPYGASMTQGVQDSQSSHLAFTLGQRLARAAIALKP